MSLWFGICLSQPKSIGPKKFQELASNCRKNEDGNMTSLQKQIDLIRPMAISVYVGKKDVMWRDSSNCHVRQFHTTAPLFHLDIYLIITSA